MDPEDWSPMVCEALETGLRSLRAFAAGNTMSCEDLLTSQAYLLQVVANLEVVKAIVASDGEKVDINSEEIRCNDGGTDKSREEMSEEFVLSAEQKTIEESTQGMRDAVARAHAKIAEEERLRAMKRAERQAQKEKKLLKEQQSAEEKAVAPTSWFCPGCTFENKLSARKCEVCSTYRPADAVPTPASNAKEKLSSPRIASKKNKHKSVEEDFDERGESLEGDEGENQDEMEFELDEDNDEATTLKNKKS